MAKKRDLTVPQALVGDFAAMSGATAVVAEALYKTTATAALRRRLRRLAITIEAAAEAVAIEAGLGRGLAQIAVENGIGAARESFNLRRVGDIGAAKTAACSAVYDAVILGGEAAKS